MKSKLLDVLSKTCLIISCGFAPEEPRSPPTETGTPTSYDQPQKIPKTFTN